MGKCSWKNIKGNRIGEECGIYCNKIIEGKFYCAAHYKYMVDDKVDKVTPIVTEIKSACACELKEEPIKEVIKEEVKIEIPEVIKSIENGDSLEDVMDYKYSKTVPDNDLQVISRKLNVLTDKVDYIMSQFVKKDLGIQDEVEEELPEMETF